jgi:hypothetical protein
METVSSTQVPKPYKKPELRIYGDIRQITLSGPGSTVPDSPMSSSMHTPGG